MLPTPAQWWMLAQTLWLGINLGYWLLFAPVLRQIGFAPLLVSEVHHVVQPLLLLIAAAGLLVQLWTLACVVQGAKLIADERARLVGVALLGVLLSALLWGWEGSKSLHVAGSLAYFLALGAGVVLVTRPLPERRECKSSGINDQ